MPKKTRPINTEIQTDVVCFPHFATIECPAIVYRNVFTQTIISLEPSREYHEIVDMLSKNLKDIAYSGDVSEFTSRIRRLRRHVRFSDASQDVYSESSTLSIEGVVIQVSDFEVIDAKDCYEENPN